MFYETLDFSLEFGSSDIHFTEGKVPYVRKDGELLELKGFPLISKEHIQTIFKELKAPTIDKPSYDTSFQYRDARYRVHAFKSLYGWSFSFRVIPTAIPDFDTLDLPKALKELVKQKNGLILVTGVTGSGKSTTLASMIQLINKEQNKRIITIEDPVEFLYDDIQSVVVQRELGKDFDSFSSAIKEAMRQDPDIMLVGELRDLDTIRNAITLANTGHLVFGTLHSKSVSETFDRIIDVFPPEQQKQIRSQLSNVVQGVISQRLLKKENGGRIPSVEVLIMNTGARNIIAQGANLSQIEDQMLMNSKKNGSQTFIQSLADLYKKGFISKETALEECGSNENQEKFINQLT